MATVDNGIITRSDSSWLRVKPRCPYCGHMENDYQEVSIGQPMNEYHRPSVSYSCGSCHKTYKITAYIG